MACLNSSISTKLNMFLNLVYYDIIVIRIKNKVPLKVLICFIFRDRHIWAHIDFFKFSVDATKTNTLCRYVNDSPTISSNCKMKLHCLFDKPYLCLFATKNIEKDEELRYDYGDEANMWWRNDVSKWIKDMLNESNIKCVH